MMTIDKAPKAPHDNHERDPVAASHLMDMLALLGSLGIDHSKLTVPELQEMYEQSYHEVHPDEQDETTSDE